jgi:ankyrin repeat protein
MEIFEYCKTGNFELVRHLPANTIDPNTKDDHGNTPLYYASKHGHLNIVQELLEHNAPVNERNQYSITALHVCSTAEIARLLIQYGAEIEAREAEDNTPLHYASSTGSADVVQEIINNGADINAKDDAAQTPLHQACQNGHLNVVQALIRNGALLNEPDYRDDTPLHYASSNGSLEIIKLLGPCCDWTIKNERGHTAFDCAKTDEIREFIRSLDFMDIKEPSE